MMRDKEVTTIINGKAVHDRKTLLQGVTFDYSTTLSRLVHPTITIRQKKAITNKCDGITIQAYDKKAEIENKSNKRYISWIITTTRNTCIVWKSACIIRS